MKYHAGCMIPFFCNNQLPERGAPFLIIEVRGPGTVKTCMGASIAFMGAHKHGQEGALLAGQCTS